MVWVYLLLAGLLFLFAFWFVFRYTGSKEPIVGSVFITGCDSGMGKQTALHLAEKGFRVFAGVYLDDSFAIYQEKKNIIPIQIDVTSEESVQQALDQVKRHMGDAPDLYGLLQCAGIAYTAPFEYFPMDNFRHQLEVNFMGYVITTQAFLPILKESTAVPGARRGRIAFVSSGPVPGPVPPFISAYLASKWAGDAFCQALRMELKLRNIPIDPCMVSPGVVKPTRLASDGLRILQRSWKQMPPQAKEEYGGMIEAFVQFQAEQPGTHVSVVGKQMEKIMTDGRPFLRYYVGFDAKASFVVGLLPTGLKQWLLRNTAFMHYASSKDCPKLFF